MFRNIIANFIGRFWAILSNFLFIPLYIKFLGFENFSIISFTLIITALMAILDAGLTATLSREFARGDITKTEKSRIFKTLESSYFILVFCCISTVILISGLIAENWLNTDSFSPETISLYLKIVSFDIGFQLLLRFYSGGLFGLEKQVLANIYQISWGFVRNGGVVIAIMISPSLEVFFYWQSVSTILFAFLIRFSLDKNLHGYWQMNFNLRIEKEVLKKVWKFAGGMLLLSLIASLNTQMDKIAISKLLSVEYLGYFTLAVSLSMGIVIIVNAVSLALLPRFTAFYSEGKTGLAIGLFNFISPSISILAFTLMANMSIFSKEIIWAWTGSVDLAEQSFGFIPIISLAYTLLALQIIPFNVAIANGYTKLNNILGLISLLVTIPGYWIITTTYGAKGTALVFCSVQAVTTFAYLYFINKKFIGNKIIPLYLNYIILPLLTSLFIAFIISQIPFNFHNRLVSLFWVGMASGITFICNIIIFLPRNDVKRIVKILAGFSKIST